ncbi:MAG TPA: hypothetical protein V6C69_07295 [Trichormus sp.]
MAMMMMMMMMKASYREVLSWLLVSRHVARALKRISKRSGIANVNEFDASTL